MALSRFLVKISMGKVDLCSPTARELANERWEATERLKTQKIVPVPPPPKARSKPTEPLETACPVTGNYMLVQD